MVDELDSLLKKYEDKLLNLKEVYKTITIDDYDRGSNLAAQSLCNEIIDDIKNIQN